MYGDQQRKNRASYSEEQIGAVLSDIGLEPESETGKDFICFCPYHSNTDTPSFSVSKHSGVYLCFNAMCGAKGTLAGLVKDNHPDKLGEFEVLRFILKRKGVRKHSLADEVARNRKKQEDFNIMPAAMFDRLHAGLLETPDAVRYLVEERGFDEDTLEEFYIGYSAKMGMVTVPMHDPLGNYVGLIGRSVEGKRFKNSVGLPVSRTLWNLHRAKAASDTLILVEASFDAMRVSQAGYPNVAALLGGNLSNLHIELIEKYFNSIVIMTDFDDKSNYIQKYCRKCPDPFACLGHNPGRELGKLIAERVKGKRIRWASYDYKIVYPNNAKDPGDLTDDEIVHCIKNSVNNLEYSQWQLT